MSACAKCGYDAAAVVVARWSFVVDRDPPSLNARLHNSGARRWAYKRERDDWRTEIRGHKFARGVRVAAERRRVTLTRLYAGRQKRRDQDNLAGGMKAVVDALVLEALLVDDSEQHSEIHYAQVRGDQRGLLIEIEVLG